jgi:hypothetical protein
MAYSSTNPPELLVGGLAGDGRQLWSYNSTHTAGEAAAAGFISNGYALGMKTHDAVLVAETTSPLTGSLWMFVSVVTASSAATLTSVTTST